ncbi:type 1 periplasmic binding fold superfamily protein [Flavobacteriaceae bacterium S356]|uniref:Type 1 periplasmic binding fold superfamily protein n=1 Tax=Asprobacillus argus TaxID=3076534 RepID=A0ABU3LFZ1_9FLAO|nr:type 1 periplasmic binding fold superfamily protein [Flavobacteriaceae bacterium S356]
MKNFKLLTLLFIATTVFVSCNDSDPVPVNEEEVITTLIATLTPQGGVTDITLQSQDLDGDGPNAPVITVSGNLAANTTYNGILRVLNETETPAENVTLEVESEGDEHQFFFTSDNNLVSSAYTDMDANGRPIGITFTLTTTNAGTGNLTITLRHEPVKTATGVSAGDITNAGGETDIEATFAITVQ